MLVNLHRALAAFLQEEAPPTSLLRAARLDFQTPDADFRSSLDGLTLNLYLHEIRENLTFRGAEPLVHRSSDGAGASRRRAPGMVDCGYYLTAWSVLTRDQHPEEQEHALLGEVLILLLRVRQISERHWRAAGLDAPPYPTVIAQPDAQKNLAEFWNALGRPPKPVLTYVVTVAVPLDTSADVPVVRPD
jgi:hypothetical protein